MCGAHKHTVRSCILSIKHIEMSDRSGGNCSKVLVRQSPVKVFIWSKQMVTKTENMLKIFQIQKNLHSILIVGISMLQFLILLKTRGRTFCPLYTDVRLCYLLQSHYLLKNRLGNEQQFLSNLELVRFKQVLLYIV